MDLLHDGIPCRVGQVEDQVFRTIIDRSAQNPLPILEVRPCLFRARARERRESLSVSTDPPTARSTYAEELEQDATKRPVISREGVRFASENLWRHTRRSVTNPTRSSLVLTSRETLQPSRPCGSAGTRASSWIRLTYRGSAILMLR